MRIPHRSLLDIIKQLLLAAGSDNAEAAQVSHHLVRANLCGHDSHGVGMIPAYMRHLGKGLLVPRTPARQLADQGVILTFSGDRGYGQRTAAEATQAGLDRAKQQGLALITLRDAHHIGRVGTYGEQAIAAGMVGLFFVNVTDHAPLVAPFRGTQARFGTNPICIAIPGTDDTEAVLLDMATSKLALGKTRVAMNTGKQVAEDTLIDADGKPTRDPSVMFSDPMGALMPLGEHKGYGLAMICELLAGILSGGGTLQPDNARQGSIVNHMLAIFIDPARFATRDWIEREFDRMVAYAVGTPPQDAAAPVLKPGDPERIAYAERSRSGIPMDPTTWEQILAAGESVGFARERAIAIAGEGAPRT